MSISETDDRTNPLSTRFRTTRAPGFSSRGQQVGAPPSATPPSATPPSGGGGGTTAPVSSTPLSGVGLGGGRDDDASFFGPEGDFEGPPDTGIGDPNSVLGRAVLGIAGSVIPGAPVLMALGRGVNSANEISDVNQARGVLGFDELSAADKAVAMARGTMGFDTGLGPTTAPGIAATVDPSLGFGVPGVDAIGPAPGTPTSIGPAPSAPAQVSDPGAGGGDGIGETGGGVSAATAAAEDPSMGFGVPGIDASVDSGISGGGGSDTAAGSSGSDTTSGSVDGSGPGADTSGIGDGGGGGGGGDGDSIICTELYNQGKLPRRTYVAANAWADRLSDYTRQGYFWWARPVVARMQDDKDKYAVWVGRLVRPVLNAAAKKGGVGRGSIYGAIILHTGMPICWALGLIKVHVFDREAQHAT